MDNVKNKLVLDKTHGRTASSRYATAFTLILSLIVGFVPWWEMRSQRYIDRENYILFIDVVPSKLYWFNFDGLVPKVVNEWGWHLFTFALSNYMSLDGPKILLIVTISLVMVSSLLLIRWSGAASIWLLLNPIFIDFAVSQSRLALAMSLISLSLLLYRTSKIASLFILSLAPFVHTSSVLFIFIIGLQVLLAQYHSLSGRIKAGFAVISGLTVSIVTGPLMGQILSSLEDRRANYNDMSPPIFYTLFWVALFLYLFARAIFNKTKASYPFYVAIAALSILFFNLFFPGYPIRFIAACFPFIVASLFTCVDAERHVVISSYMAMTVLLWMFWLT
jgi:hypothetical protein